MITRFLTLTSGGFKVGQAGSTPPRPLGRRTDAVTRSTVLLICDIGTVYYCDTIVMLANAKF